MLLLEKKVNTAYKTWITLSNIKSFLILFCYMKPIGSAGVALSCTCIYPDCVALFLPICIEKDKEDVSSPSEGYKTDLSVVMNAWFSAGFHTGK